MPLPSMHPITKTAKEVRRSQGRLETFRLNNPHDPHVINGTVNELIKSLHTVALIIPEDLKETQEV